MMNLYEVIQLRKFNRGTYEEFLAACKPFLNDKESVLKLIKETGLPLLYISDDLKTDREVVLSAIKKDGANLEYADSSFYTDKEAVIAAIKSPNANHIPKIIKAIPESMRNDDEVALLALFRNMYVLEFLPEKYRNNKDVLPKFSVGCLVYKFLTPEARDDEELVAKVVKDWGPNLEHVPEKYKDNYDVVLSAVKSDGEALQFASERLKSDVKIVKSAIREYWSAVYYASDVAKDNPDIMKYAGGKETQYFRFASKRLLNDPKFVLEMLKIDTAAVMYASEEMQKELANQTDPITYLKNKVKSKNKMK